MSLPVTSASLSLVVANAVVLLSLGFALEFCLSVQLLLFVVLLLQSPQFWSFAASVVDVVYV